MKQYRAKERIKVTLNNQLIRDVVELHYTAYVEYQRVQVTFLDRKKKEKHPDFIYLSELRRLHRKHKKALVGTRYMGTAILFLGHIESIGSDKWEDKVRNVTVVFTDKEIMMS